MSPRLAIGSLLLIFTFAYLLGGAIDEATPHLPAKQPQPIVLLKETRAQVHARQSKNLHHARYVCNRGKGRTKRWHCLAATGWLLREWRETRPRPLTPQAAICKVFGAQCLNAIRVAHCETGGTFSVYAQNGQYLGLFQMGSYARARYGHSYTAIGQARSAYAYYRDAGWAPWECAHIVGIL